MHAPLARLMAPLVLLLAAGACSPGEWPYRGAGHQVATRLEPTFSWRTLEEGQEVDVHVRAYGRGAVELFDLPPARWSSSQPEVLECSPTGRLRARLPGVSQLTVERAGLRHTVEVEVTPLAPSRLVLRGEGVGSGGSFDSLNVVVGKSRQLEAVLVNPLGRETPAAATWTAVSEWSGRAPVGTVLTVSPEGRVTGVTNGGGTVTAAVGALRATLRVNVLWPQPAALRWASPPPDVLPQGSSWVPSVEVLDADGSVLPPEAWSSPLILTGQPAAVLSTWGSLVARAPGQATLTASLGSLRLTRAVTVVGPAAGGSPVRVSPGAVPLSVGDTRLLRVEARDAGGAPLVGRPVVWSSGDVATVAVSAEGRLTARAPGVTTVTAEVDGQRGSAWVQVLPAGGTRLLVVGGDGRTVRPGRPVENGRPRFRLVDAQGRGVRGTYSLLLVSGGGQLDTLFPPTPGGLQLWTDSDGYAEVLWTLGSEPGMQLFSVSALGHGQPAGPPVVFSALAAPPASDFQLDFRLSRPLSEEAQRTLQDVADRFREVIKGRLPAQRVLLAGGACFPGSPAVDVADLTGVVILLEETTPELSGEGGVCAPRSGGALPAVGVLRVDPDMLEALEAAPNRSRLMHGLAHALGLGTLWDRDGLVAGLGTKDAHFTGAAAREAYRALGGDATPGSPVPLEPSGAHWRASAIGPDVLAPLDASAGGSTPLGRFTAAALGDLGYAVDVQAADAWPLRPAVADGLAPAPPPPHAPSRGGVVLPRLTPGADGTARPLEAR